MKILKTTPTSANKKPASICRHWHMKEVEENDDLFSFSTPCYSISYHNLITITTTKKRWIWYQEFYRFSIYLFLFSSDLDLCPPTRWKKATKTRAMIAVTTLDVINMYHHIQTRRIHIQSFGILSHLCSLTLWIT
jgi:hypothetical protein